MRIARRKREMMFDADRRDPEIVFWNRLSLLFQRQPERGIDRRCGNRDIQHLAASDEAFDFGEVLGAAPGIQRAVSEFTDDGDRKNYLFGGRGKEGTGLVS